MRSRNQISLAAGTDRCRSSGLRGNVHRGLESAIRNVGCGNLKACRNRIALLIANSRQTFAAFSTHAHCFPVRTTYRFLLMSDYFGGFAAAMRARAASVSSCKQFNASLAFFSNSLALISNASARR